MATLASGGARATSHSRGVLLAAALVGAVLYGFFNLVAFEIQMPGTQDVSIRPHYGLLTFFGFAFGPAVGFAVGYLGNSLGDLLTAGDPFGSWWWSVANGLAGLVAGLAGRWGMGRVRDGGRRAAGAAAWSVVATVIGFGFIWVEVLMPGQGGTGTIMSTEYLPVVIGNSIAAAIITPILVLAWTPLGEHLLP